MRPQPPIPPCSACRFYKDPSGSTVLDARYKEVGLSEPCEPCRLETDDPGTQTVSSWRTDVLSQYRGPTETCPGFQAAPGAIADTAQLVREALDAWDRV